MDPSVLGAAAGVEGVEAAEDPLAAGLFVDCCGRGGVGGAGEAGAAEGAEETTAFVVGTARRPELSWGRAREVPRQRHAKNRNCVFLHAVTTAN